MYPGNFPPDKFTHTSLCPASQPTLSGLITDHIQSVLIRNPPLEDLPHCVQRLWSPKHTSIVWCTSKCPPPLFSMHKPGRAALWHFTPVFYFQRSPPRPPRVFFSPNPENTYFLHQRTGVGNRILGWQAAASVCWHAVLDAHMTHRVSFVSVH